LAKDGIGRLPSPRDWAILVGSLALIGVGGTIKVYSAEGDLGLGVTVSAAVVLALAVIFVAGLVFRRSSDESLPPSAEDSD